jgi:UDP-glucose 4-epimerase
MRVVLTGGGGFIGSYLLDRLAGAGIDVTLIGPNTGRSPYTASLVEAGQVRFLECDDSFQDEDALRVAFADADALVLLGYVMPTSSVAAQRLLDEYSRNVEPVVRLLRASEGRAGQVVFASSVSVYGVPARAPVSESDAPRPSTPYGVAKLACEHAIRILCEASGRSAGILRYATVYGSGELVPRAIPNFIRAALAGQRPTVHGDGLDEHDYVHVADVADATLAAIQRRANGIFNVGTGVSTSTLDVAHLVLKLAGKKVTPVCDAPRAPARSRFRLACDTELARAQLGFKARRPLAEGISEEIAWFRSRLIPGAPQARMRQTRSEPILIARPGLGVASPAARPTGATPTRVC